MALWEDIDLVSSEDLLPFQNQIGRMGNAWARYFNPGTDIFPRIMWFWDFEFDSEDNFHSSTKRFKFVFSSFRFWFVELPEVTPYNDGTTFDPLYGFPNGRKERGNQYCINWIVWKWFQWFCVVKMLNGISLHNMRYISVGVFTYGSSQMSTLIFNANELMFSWICEWKQKYASNFSYDCNGRGNAFSETTIRTTGLLCPYKDRLFTMYCWRFPVEL